MTTCVKCGCTSLGYQYLVDGDRWCERCLPIEVMSIREQLASAQESARWLLYDAPCRPYTEVEEFVRERPWLNCLKTSKSSGGEA